MGTLSSGKTGLPTAYNLATREYVCVCVCVRESHGERYQETESGRERTRERAEKKKGGKKKSVEIRGCKSTMVVLNGFELFVQLT